jgi:dimethylhistidine N-methyltransferase
MSSELPGVGLLDLEPVVENFLHEVLDGLRADKKRLPCKFFYDQRGSRLFDAICELPEYYLTRTELEIMKKFAPQMATQIGPEVMLVEYGSGSSVKTRLLLDHLENTAAYVPVDISRDHLQDTANALSLAYPHIEFLPVCVDFTQPFELPVSTRQSSHAAVYFPGSTIGNFHPDEVKRLLRLISPLCGTGGGLLIGIDLKKEPHVIEAAYNDAQGVTAEFNLNLLHRINRELDADFDLDEFQHIAKYNQELGRVEIGLVSARDQVVTIDGESIEFAAGEGVNTEYSHKYEIEQFAEYAATAGLSLHKHWTDERKQFAVLHFAVEH